MENNVVHMPVVNQQIVDNIVKQLKAQGIFDQFRRDCLADVDTKPSYQNLRQRVEGYVSKFLSQQSWNPSMNKNQLRDELRRQINESGMLSIGVEHVVDQIVHSKANRVFLPQIEIAARRYLGLDKNHVTEEQVNDDRDGDKCKTSETKVSYQNGDKGRSSPLIKEVPSHLINEDKAQDNVNNIDEAEQELKNEETKVPVSKAEKEFDSYSILNTSRETETTISGDDELLPPGVDLDTREPPKPPDVEEYIRNEDTSSSFNSEPLVIYDPQASNENSRDVSQTTDSNACSPKDNKNELERSKNDLDSNLPFAEATVIKEPKIENSENVVKEINVDFHMEIVADVANESKTIGDADDKKSLETEIKKLLELGDKEKLEQEIRRILEIESKKMVEKELKKRESLEAAKLSNLMGSGSEENRALSLESRSNSSTDLTKDKPSSKNEKTKATESSSKASAINRSNSSSDVIKDKHSSKNEKSKSFSESSSKLNKDALKNELSKHKSQPSEKIKKHDSKTSSSKSSSSSSKTGASKNKPEVKSDSKLNNDKSKSTSKHKSSTSPYSLVKPVAKNTSVSKSKMEESSKPKSSGTSKVDSSAKTLKSDSLKEKSSSSKFVPVKSNNQKPVMKSSTTHKDLKDNSKTKLEVDTKIENESSIKEIEKSDDHVFKSPDLNQTSEKKVAVELESSETDEDFIRALNNCKKTEDCHEEDKKSDVSVSSVHTSDLSSFDDEISLSSSDELKSVPIPSPVKEVKKILLKNTKVMSAAITEGKPSSNRNSPIPLVEVTEKRKKKAEEKYEQSTTSGGNEDFSSSQDLTSETQTTTDDDDKGRTGIRSGLRRQRKINPKYASDEYSSMFNKTRRGKKTMDDSKSKNQANSESSDPRKRRYSKTRERQSSKGDSESETPVKSSKSESGSSRGARGRQSRS